MPSAEPRRFSALSQTDFGGSLDDDDDGDDEMAKGLALFPKERERTFHLDLEGIVHSTGHWSFLDHKLSLRKRKKSRFLPLYYSYRRLEREARGNLCHTQLEHQAHPRSCRRRPPPSSRTTAVFSCRLLPSTAGNAAAASCTVGGRPVSTAGGQGCHPKKPSFGRDPRLARDGARLITGPFRPPGEPPVFTPAAAPCSQVPHPHNTHLTEPCQFFSKEEGLLFSLTDHPARPIGRDGSNQKELLASPDSPSPRASLATSLCR